jgi:hypothetical protein
VLFARGSFAAFGVKMMMQFTRPTQEPDLEVELTLFPTDQGGRKYALWQGCRIPHDFGLPDEMNDGMYEFIGQPPQPGETQRAYVWLLAPERNRGRIDVGFEYRIWESRFVGKGKVLRVINRILRAEQGHAGDARNARA